MPIVVKEIAFVHHTVTDMPRARRFYEGVLGLKVALEYDIGDGQWWIEYDIAGQALAISNLGRGRPAAALALEVADLDAAFAAAKSAGAKLVGDIVDVRPCRMFQLMDDDGNEITLHQRKARA